MDDLFQSSGFRPVARKNGPGDMFTWLLSPLLAMLPELSSASTVIAFLTVIGVGVVGLMLMPVNMTEETIFTMVLPSMIIFGGIMVAIGIAHGKFRAN